MRWPFLGLCERGVRVSEGLGGIWGGGLDGGGRYFFGFEWGLDLDLGWGLEILRGDLRVGFWGI